MLSLPGKLHALRASHEALRWSCGSRLDLRAGQKTGMQEQQCCPGDTLDLRRMRGPRNRVCCSSPLKRCHRPLAPLGPFLEEYFPQKMVQGLTLPPLAPVESSILPSVLDSSLCLAPCHLALWGGDGVRAPCPLASRLTLVPHPLCGPPLNVPNPCSDPAAGSCRAQLGAPEAGRRVALA